jgi:hypothetical protein
LAYGLFDVLNAPQLACIHLANFEAKTVRAQIDGGVEGVGLHSVESESGQAK